MNLDGILVEFEVEVLDGLVRGLPDDRRDGFMGEIVPDFCVIGRGYSCSAGLTMRLVGMRERASFFVSY
jgi:hypothetical protein